MMRLSLARAEVTTEAGDSWDDVVVQATRDSRLVVRQRGGSGDVLLDVAATAVRSGGVDRSWSVDTEQGVVTVKRKAGCGCGG